MLAVDGEREMARPTWIFDLSWDKEASVPGAWNDSRDRADRLALKVSAALW